MQYALLAYEDIDTTEARTDEEHGELLAGYGKVAQALAEQGKLVFGDGLRSSVVATTVRPGTDQAIVTDGPITEGREHLIGVFVIEATDLDEALDWARQMPHAQTSGGVEVRPVGA